MLLKSIKLSNIRSYINETINFPIGSVLLEGDIGSGKSSVLLAIEYALFGIKTAHYSASSLLRHGSNSGYVELSFNVDGKDYVINRKLKRGKNEIKQESGYIIKNGIKKEGTTVELKSEMFDILGYPRELLAKGTDILYRFTVYTPQEEMKQILYENKDIRLDTLRKVFGIDKYKRIRENSAIFIRHIKEKNKENEGKIFDLLEKQEQKDEREGEIKEIKIEIENLSPRLNELKNKVLEKERELKKNEDDIKILNNLKIESNKNEVNLKNYNNLKEYNKRKILELENEIKKLGEELKKIKKEEINENNIKKIEEDIEEKEEELKQIHFKISELKVINNQSNRLIIELSSISKCPVCKQNVSDNYKKDMISEEEKKIKENKLKQDELISIENEIKIKLNNLKEELKILNIKKNEFEIYRLKEYNIDKLKKNKENFLKEIEDIEDNIIKLNKKNIELNKEIEELKDIEEIYNKNKEGLNNIKKEERLFEIKKAELDKELESINKIISLLTEEINKKIKIKENLNYLKELQNWLENYFINLTSIMEKNIMLSIYRQFNELFQDWFNMLMEEETLQVKLDEEFTPIIEQNGYETSVENLSGGEKTSLALAYRLSLNKVINDLISQIKTKDLIILDEPTDGFSTEQLEKVRDVLDQLNMKQVIIVSHETKIESFVDNVIKISKDEHISRIY